MLVLQDNERKACITRWFRPHSPGARSAATTTKRNTSLANQRRQASLVRLSSAFAQSVGNAEVPRRRLAPQALLGLQGLQGLVSLFALPCIPCLQGLTARVSRAKRRRRPPTVTRIVIQALVSLPLCFPRLPALPRNPRTWGPPRCRYRPLRLGQGGGDAIQEGCRRIA